MLIVGDGFTSGSDSAFLTAATNIANAFASTPPLSSFSNKINIYYLYIHSTSSGITRSNENPGVVNTFFGMNFGTFGQRVTDIANRPLLFEIAREYLPQYTAIHVLGNSSTYGGVAIASGVGTSTLETNTTEQGTLMTHELGHAIFGLSDEYGTDGVLGGTTFPGGSIFGPWGGTSFNVTDTVLHETAQWQSLNTGPPVLVTNPNCSLANNSVVSGVGRFEEAGYYNCGLYRPTANCKMRTLASAFCPVCSARISSYMTAL